MEQISIRHVSGDRAQQVDQFGSDWTGEIIVGRDLNAAVRFERDDLVSRQHLKIVRDLAEPGVYKAVDLQSSNGTFLNGNRIYGSARLKHNDLIQLGAGGPEFRFEIAGSAVPGPTRLVDSGVARNVALPPTAAGGSVPPAMASPRPVGRATVERLINDSAREGQEQSKKTMWAAIAGVAAMIVVGAGIFMYMRQSAADSARLAERNQAMIRQVDQAVRNTPAEVAALKSALAKSDARNEKNLKALTELLSAQLGKPGSAGAGSGSASREVAKSAPATRTVSAPKEPPPAPAAKAVDAPPQPAPRATDAAPFDYDEAIETGVDLIKAQALSAATSLANRAIQTEPKRWEAYSLAATAAEMQGDKSQAKQHFEKALALAPADVKPSIQAALQNLP